MEVQQTFTFRLNANNGWYDSLQSIYTASLWYITFYSVMFPKILCLNINLNYNQPCYTFLVIHRLFLHNVLYYASSNNENRYLNKNIFLFNE